MKTRHSTRLALAVLALGTGPLLAQTTTWYGVNNNAAAAGAVVDGSAAIANADWHDAVINGAAAQQGVTVNNATLSARALKTNVVSQSQLISVFRLDGLTISDTVTSASLWLNFSLVSGAAPFDVSFVPINNSAAWTEADATWDSLVDTSFIDETSTLNAVTISAGNGWRSYDLTTLFSDMVAGNNAGIAIVLPQVISSGAAFPSITFASSENADANLTPGFQVTTIPEPSSALLGGLGILALLRRRR